MKTTRLFLILVAGLALAGLSAPAAQAARHGVTVTRISFAGWSGAVKISNGIVEAVVVPQIGRIMMFQWVGQPISDPVFRNKDWAGKTIAGVPQSTWANFGGDKLWPSNQGDWPKHMNRGWPPDQAFDGDPQTATILSDGVRLESPMSASFAARDVRVITMKPGQARLYIHQVLIKDPKAVGSKNGFPIGIWSITQSRGDGTIFLPISRTGAEATDFYVMKTLTDWLPIPDLPADMKAAWNPGFWKPVDGVMIGRRDTKGFWKLASKTGAGWIASLYAGNILFSEHYTYKPGATYADAGFPAEIFNSAKPPYFEMELLGPVRSLKAGEKETYDIYWQLNHLPRVPKSDKDACVLVKRVE